MCPILLNSSYRLSNNFDRQPVLVFVAASILWHVAGSILFHDIATVMLHIVVGIILQVADSLTLYVTESILLRFRLAYILVIGNHKSGDCGYICPY